MRLGQVAACLVLLLATAPAAAQQPSADASRPAGCRLVTSLVDAAAGIVESVRDNADDWRAPAGAAWRHAGGTLDAVARETGAFLGGLDRTIGPGSPLWAGLGGELGQLLGSTGSLARRLGGLAGSAHPSPGDSS